MTRNRTRYASFTDKPLHYNGLPVASLCTINRDIKPSQMDLSLRRLRDTLKLQRENALLEPTQAKRQRALNAAIIEYKKACESWLRKRKGLI